MAKYVVDEAIFKRLADAIRAVNSTTRSYTPDEMIEAVTHILEGGTYILVDEDGLEIPAVFVDNEPRFTATENDIRIGTTALTDAGVTEGTKEIPSYHSTEGYKVITAGSKFTLLIPNYEYTKLMAVFCPFNTSMTNSVAADRTVIDNNVYPVQSTTAEASVTVVANDVNGYIDFGVTNTSSKPYLIRYFTFKEIY